MIFWQKNAKKSTFLTFFRESPWRLAVFIQNDYKLYQKRVFAPNFIQNDVLFDFLKKMLKNALFSIAKMMFFSL